MAETVFDKLGLETDPTKAERPQIVSEGELARALETAKSTQKQVGFLGGVGIGLSEGVAPTAIEFIDRRWSSSEPVVNFSEEQVDFLVGDLTDKTAYTEVLEEAKYHGMERATLMRDSYLAQQENNAIVANSGFSGVTGRVLAEMFDPTEWAIIGGTAVGATALGTPVAGVGTLAAGAANRARKAYNVGSNVWKGAGLGAAEMAAFESLRAEMRYDTEMNDVLIAMGLGAGLGGTFSAVATTMARRGAVSELSRRIVAGETLDDFTPSERALYENFNVDATAARLIERHAGEIGKDLEPEAPTALSKMTTAQADVAPESETIWGTTKLRRLISSGARTMTSSVGRIRSAGAALSANSAGFKLDSNGKEVTSGISASETQELLQLQFRNPYAITHHKTYKSWNARTGGSLLEFNTLVSRKARGIVDEVDAEVAVLADMVVDHQKKLYKLGIKANAAGFTDDMLTRHSNYLPRVFNDDRIREVRTRLGANADVALTRLIKQAITEEQPDIIAALQESMQKTRKSKKKVTAKEAEEKLDSMAQGYMEIITRPKLGKAPSRGSEFNLQDLEEMLTARGHLTDEVDAIMDALAYKTGKRGIKRTKPRILLNERSTIKVENVNGELEDLSFHELLEEDIEQLHNQYIFGVTGAIGLARKGIDTNEAGSSFQDVIDAINKDIKDKNLDSKDHQSEISALEFMYDGITGRLAQREDVSDKAREFNIAVRAYSFAVSMGMSGMSALMELSNALFEYSLPVLLKSVPQLGRITNLAKRGELDDDIIDELIAAFGLGEEIALGRFNNASRFEGSNVEGSIAPQTQGLAKFMGDAQQKVSYFSGLQGVTQSLRRLSMLNYTNSWARSISKGKLPFSRAKLSQLGIDQDMAGRIIQNMRDHTTLKPNGSVRKLNLNDWDADVREAFQASGFKEARQNVQEMNIGSTNGFLRGEVGKTYFQFLSFPLASLEQQTARLAARGKHGDVLGVGKIVLTSALQGALLYTLRVHLNSVGRSDRKEYLEKRLAPAAFAQGALSQIGAFSIFGLIYGATTGGMGGNTNMITPPAVGLVGKAIDTSKAFADFEFTETELRNLLRLFPAQSLYGVSQAFNGIANEFTKDK